MDRTELVETEQGAYHVDLAFSAGKGLAFTTHAANALDINRVESLACSTLVINISAANQNRRRTPSERSHSWGRIRSMRRQDQAIQLTRRGLDLPGVEIAEQPYCDSPQHQRDDIRLRIRLSRD